MRKPLELYVHIPFCVKKCDYCNFLSFSKSREDQQLYVQALLKEIKSYESFSSEYSLSTIFIGGGTPSVLQAKQIQLIMEGVYNTFTVEKDAEITIESNPESVTKEKLDAYRAAGINRISLGLQSTHNEELKRLGRIHSYEDFLESFELTRNAGFENINVDLISAIPEQTIEAWIKNLQRVIELRPEHISAYSLIIEEGTPFFDRDLILPDEDSERSMYDTTNRLLANVGYQHYEISNYAKPGYECKHNLGYWNRKDYLGVGLGAASLLQNERHSNTRQFNEYLEESGEWKRIWNDVEDLSVQACMEEFMFLGLRMTLGVSREEFYHTFHKTITEVYGPVLTNLFSKGLVKEEQGYIRLTKRGVEVSNYVLSEFLLD